MICNVMPGGTTSKKLYWVYVLLSLKDDKRYIGYTHEINRRLEEHANGKVPSTKFRRPLKVIYVEGCLDKEDAERREKYLKTTDGRKFLAKRLKSYYGYN